MPCAAWRSAMADRAQVPEITITDSRETHPKVEVWRYPKAGDPNPKVKLAVDRVRTFDGPVTLHLSPMQGLDAPEVVVIPKGQTATEFEVKAAADAQARKQNWQLTATADVSGFEEELRAAPVEIEVKKVEVPKKK